MSPRKKKSAPLYRKLIPIALRESWNSRWLWPFALFAAWLMTGGIYDVMLTSLQELRTRQDIILHGQLPQTITIAWSRLTDGSSILHLIGAWESVLFASIFILAVLSLSIIGQGALVHGIGGRIRGRKPHFRESLAIGTKFFVQTMLLNIFILGLTWFAKFLMFIPYRNSILDPSIGHLLGYLFTTVLFIVTLIVLTSVHLFTLNAMILQEASLHEALVRAFELLRRGWLAVLELALILFGVGMGIFALTLILFFVMIIPLVLVMFATMVLGQGFIFSLGYALGTLLFFTLFILAGVFTVTFQYAAWHLLFLKLGEGGLVAKLHRISHWFTGAPKQRRS